MIEHDKQIIFELGYNKGFKDGIKGSVPRYKIDEMIAEITKYAQAMDWISGHDVIALIHKFCDKE